MTDCLLLQCSNKSKNAIEDKPQLTGGQALLFSGYLSKVKVKVIQPLRLHMLVMQAP